MNFTLLYFLCRSSFLRITCCFIHSVFSLCSSHKGSSILSQERSTETTKQIWCLCVDVRDKKQMWAHLQRILRLVDTSEGWRPWSLVWSLQILKKLELMPLPRSLSLESWQKQNKNFSVAKGTFKLDKIAEEKFTDVYKNCIKTSDQLRKVIKWCKIHQTMQIITPKQHKLKRAAVISGMAQCSKWI